MEENNSTSTVFAVEKFAKTVTPLPIERAANGSESYVNWGDRNEYPNFLLELYDTVPLHQSIINSKVDYLIGEGMTDKSTGKPMDKMFTTKDTPAQFAQKVAFDLTIFNWFAVGVQYNVFGKPILLFHIPGNHVRTNKAKSKFWISDDWAASTSKQMSYGAFKPGINKDLETKVFLYSSYTPSIAKVYPSIKYKSAIVNMVTEAIITQFNKNDLEGGFSAAHIINFFKGIPGDKQANEFQEKFEEAYSGEKGGKWIINFNQPPTNQTPAAPITVETVQSPDYSTKLDGINKKNETNILTAHQAPSRALFGIEQAAGLNGNDLENAFSIFSNVWVKNNRNNLEDGLNSIFKHIGIPEVEFKSSGFVLPKNLSDATKEKVYTKNELRAIDGLPAIPDGDTPIEVTSPNSISLNTGGEQSQGGGEMAVGTLTALSDLVSNTTMTPEQKKNMLIIAFKLKPEDAELLAGTTTGTISPSAIGAFSKGRVLTEADFELVKDLGICRTDFSVLDETDFSAEDFRRVELYFDDAEDIERYLLENDTEGMTVSEIRAAIRKELGITVTTKELTTKINRLTEAGVIGDKQPEKKSITRDVKVLYQYEVRPGYGAEIIATTRGFCRKVIGNDRYYSREDIQQMSSIFGYDVFKHCGGWYQKPGSDEAESQCRHQWKSVRVIKKQNNG